MLDNLICEMLQQGAGLDDVLKKAIKLSRESFQRLGHYEKLLDQVFGSADFRKSQIDPLLDKERQIDAIKSRAQRGGPVRTGDHDTVQALLKKRTLEYQDMHNRFPWSELEHPTCRLITNYIEERRAHLQLGDTDRVRTAYLDAVIEEAA